MKELTFATFGAGFWTQYQLAGWQQVGGARCMAIYNRTESKAVELARRFDIPHVFTSPDALLAQVDVDFVDIVTANETHEALTRLAADYHRDVICQKPLASSSTAAADLVAYCGRAGVRLMVHENWRFQHPFREVKAALKAGTIGEIFRGRIVFSCSFPVFDNQPFLAELDRFILTDIGTHILDTTRYLFGEMRSLACTVNQVNPRIKGEDVATCLMRSASGATVIAEMSYASRTEHERFPQTFLFIEGSAGSLELSTDYLLHITTAAGTLRKRVSPPRYGWADPAYDVVHASIAACNASLLDALRHGAEAETSGADNVRTLRLVDAAYQAAQTQTVVQID